MVYALLAVFAIPTISIIFVYLTGKKSPKAAALFVAAIAIINILLVLSTVPSVISNPDHRYIESYPWISVILGSSFTLFADGVSLSLAIVSLILILAASLFSITYMAGKKRLPAYYALLCMLSVGLVGVFLTSNLLLFYFCWELMLIPAYFIVGEWGYRDAYKQAFKLLLYTHAGAVFVLLSIGAIYWLTGALDMFTARDSLLALALPDAAKWLLIALTGGFAVKMAVVPLHMWLPDAHSEAPAPMSALLSGVIISAGAYAILRLSLGMVFPAVGIEFGTDFLHALAIVGVLSAFFGALIALVSTDIKRLIAYSSIAHMGYVLFGLSLFPSDAAAGVAVLFASSIALTGTVLQIISHALSKGLLFITAGAVMHQTDERDIRKMGGLASKMPFTAAVSIIAALSIAGLPPFACFISELLIFIGAIQVMLLDQFYLVPTFLMLVITVISLAYMLRFILNIFFSSKPEVAEPVAENTEVKKTSGVSNWMKLSFVILAVLIILIGIYPAFFINLIQTVHFG
ncbi:NADH-quinone oxidoreductase subunit M [Candidatus Bathyarchaeota archaeon]|nr:NADH-quinone oxidoreductase subunit M [Candidatus Bathyarchaeota archaeon]